MANIVQIIAKCNHPPGAFDNIFFYVHTRFRVLMMRLDFIGVSDVGTRKGMSETEIIQMVSIASINSKLLFIILI